MPQSHAARSALRIHDHHGRCPVCIFSTSPSTSHMVADSYISPLLVLKVCLVELRSRVGTWKYLHPSPPASHLLGSPLPSYSYFMYRDIWTDGFTSSLDNTFTHCTLYPALTFSNTHVPIVSETKYHAHRLGRRPLQYFTAYTFGGDSSIYSYINVALESD